MTPTDKEESEHSFKSDFHLSSFDRSQLQLSQIAKDNPEFHRFLLTQLRDNTLECKRTVTRSFIGFVLACLIIILALSGLIEEGSILAFTISDLQVLISLAPFILTLLLIIYVLSALHYIDMLVFLASAYVVKFDRPSWLIFYLLPYSTLVPKTTVYPHFVDDFTLILSKRLSTWLTGYVTLFKPVTSIVAVVCILLLSALPVGLYLFVIINYYIPSVYYSETVFMVNIGFAGLGMIYIGWTYLIAFRSRIDWPVNPRAPSAGARDARASLLNAMKKRG